MCFVNIYIQNILTKYDFGVLQKSSKHFLISIFFHMGREGHPPPWPTPRSPLRASNKGFALVYDNSRPPSTKSWIRHWYVIAWYVAYVIAWYVAYVYRMVCSIRLSHGMLHTLSHGMLHTLSHGMLHTLSHGMLHTLSHGMLHTLSHGMLHTLSHGMLHTLSHGMLHTLSHGMLHTLSHGMLHTLSHGMLHPFIILYVAYVITWYVAYFIRIQQYWTRIGVFAWGQILGISPNGLQGGHCDAPRDNVWIGGISKIVILNELIVGEKMIPRLNVKWNNETVAVKFKCLTQILWIYWTIGLEWMWKTIGI